MTHQPVFLVIDDDIEVRMVVHSMLKVLGCRAVQAGNGPAALQAARDHSHELDIILIDATLGELKTADLVVALQQLTSAVIVLMSGHDIDEARRRAGHAGYFLAKPFGLGELRQMIATIQRTPRR